MASPLRHEDMLITILRDNWWNKTRNNKLTLIFIHNITTNI